MAAENFRITDDNLGVGSPKAKFRMNMDVINTLKAIELEGRTATPAEQEILSRYVGWGGLPDAFDPDKPDWANEFLELQAALTPEEYDSARRSILNAHYTSPTVIKAIYDAAEKMGFKSGNILDIKTLDLIQRLGTGTAGKPSAARHSTDFTLSVECLAFLRLGEYPTRTASAAPKRK